jgi:hypothetical protein
LCGLGNLFDRLLSSTSCEMRHNGEKMGKGVSGGTL